MNGTHGARCSSLLVVIGGGVYHQHVSTLHSMEITVCQPSILVEYYDLMTSISTVFIVFSKYPNLYFNVGYSEMYRANGHLIRHNWIIVCPVHFRISSYFQKFPFLEITIFRSSLLIGLRIFFFRIFWNFTGHLQVDLDPWEMDPSQSVSRVMDSLACSTPSPYSPWLRLMT